ncbi:hypothetical protein ABCS02_31130 [Microbacterium sp. X-17]|uniref:DUF7882 family protein n=1 Tax=Microbacterium sp. X-17 TaxID=3144404 RepID=UPI0031F57912
MGSLIYDSTVIEFDERLLLHLQIVIVNKLRRHESLTGPVVTGEDGRSEVSGRGVGSPPVVQHLMDGALRG